MGSVLKIINKGLVSSAHDISSGGLLLALAEMSLNSGVGVKIEKPKKLSNLIEYYFGEDQGRYLVEIEKEGSRNFEENFKKKIILSEVVGTIQKEYFEIQGEMKISIKDLYSVNNKWYNNFNGTHD